MAMNAKPATLGGRVTRIGDARVRAAGRAAAQQHKQKAGLLVIDGLPLARYGLHAAVRAAPDLRWLGYTADPDVAEAGVNRFEPDVVVLDSTLDPHALVASRLRTVDPSLAVMVLVNDQHRTAGYVSTASSAGVRGLLLRRREPAEVLEGIRTAYAGGRVLDPALASLTPVSRSGQGNPGTPLSLRERQVLDLIIEGHSNESISRSLSISYETVRTHVKTLLRKLEARDRAHAVARAYHLGLFSVQTASAASEQKRAVSQ